MISYTKIRSCFNTDWKWVMLTITLDFISTYNCLIGNFRCNEKDTTLANKTMRYVEQPIRMQYIFHIFDHVFIPDKFCARYSTSVHHMIVLGSFLPCFFLFKTLRNIEKIYRLEVWIRCSVVGVAFLLHVLTLPVDLSLEKRLQPEQSKSRRSMLYCKVCVTS